MKLHHGGRASTSHSQDSRPGRAGTRYQTRPYSPAPMWRQNLCATDQEQQAAPVAVHGEHEHEGGSHARNACQTKSPLLTAATRALPPTLVVRSSTGAYKLDYIDPSHLLDDGDHHRYHRLCGRYRRSSMIHRRLSLPRCHRVRCCWGWRRRCRAARCHACCRHELVGSVGRHGGAPQSRPTAPQPEVPTATRPTAALFA